MRKGNERELAKGVGVLPAWVWYALCFALPAAVMTWAYAAEGFYPFGDKSILVSDMAQQYVEFFCSLKSGDVFFSWSKALGTSYIGVFSYYLSSPLSLLTLLVPNEAMPLGLMVLVILKLGLAGLSYGVFARYYFDRLDICAVLCAVCYALCAYAVGYSVCIMWLDGLIWLPVILLGLEGLLEGRRRWLFPAALAACFVSTWYISYMIGIFCLLWFFFRAVARGLDGKTLPRRLGDFLLSALWALLLTAWLWLPTLLAMINGKLSSAVVDYAGLFNFDLSALPSQFFFGQSQYFTNAALPQVFCGTVTLFAAAGYFFLRPVKGRERLCAAGLLGVLVLSLWLSPLDKVWHLFLYPNWFPYRYAFLLSFLLVFLAQHTLHHVKDALPVARPAALALAALVCFEMGANARVILQTIDGAERYQSYSAYAQDYAQNAALVRRAGEDAPAGEFYRVGATRDRVLNVNSPLSFGYNGITHYSSCYNTQVNNTLRSLGLAQGWSWCAYYGSSHFTDALFSVRYVLTDRIVPGYDALAQQGDLGLYENPSTLPLAFVPQAAPDALTGGAVERQNQLFAALTGETQPLFTPLQPQVELHEGWVALTYAGTGSPIYLDLTDRAVTDLQVDGQSLFRYSSGSGKTRCLHCLGAPAAGESLTAVVTYDGGWDSAGKSYAYDLGLLARGVDALQNTAVAVDGSRVDLTVPAGGGTMATTIPAEDGWRAWVDGERAELSTWLDDTFLALDLPAGAERVTLRYTSPGLPLGLGLGVAALAWAGVWWYFQKKKKA